MAFITTTDGVGHDGRAAATDTGGQLHRTVAIGADTFVHRRFGNDRTAAPALPCLMGSVPSRPERASVMNRIA